MKQRSQQIYTGRVIKKRGGYCVKAFIFNGKQKIIPIAGNTSPVNENDIITYTLTPGTYNAVVHSIAAPAESALADIFALVEENRITMPYPEEVLQETNEILGNPRIDDPVLRDLTQKPFITIDNEGSRDLDQALCIEKVDALYRIYYALADGAFYVRPGTRLFAEALKRGATYYFPGFSVPMLPPELSEGILSLNPGVERRSFIFIMDMDRNGNIREYQCLQGRIISRAQLTYNGVQDFYNQPDTSTLHNREYTEVLWLLKEVGEIRIEMGRRTNRVQFRREEALISCSQDGMAFDISLEVRNDCSLYNEQLSLMCNMVGAQFLADESDPDVQGIFRVHHSPDNKAFEELSHTIREILDSRGTTDPAWSWHRETETLGDYMDRLYTLPGNNRLIEALERQVLLSMQRSMFTSIAGEHYALSVHPYSRFSSPMREIVGIFIHKEALEKLGTQKKESIESDIVLRDEVIKAGNRSRNLQKLIERKVVEAAAERLFRHELHKPPEKRTRYPATILGIKQSRLYIRLDSPPIELKVYTKDLEAFTCRTFEFEKSCLICGKTRKVLYKPGDEFIVYVNSYSQSRWRLVPEKPGD